MRLFLLACCCVCFISCSGTENSPPVLQLELDGVDPEASRIIQLNYEQAKTGEDWFELAQYLHAHGLSSNAIKAVAVHWVDGTTTSFGELEQGLHTLDYN